jgi:NarL family two-component system response regulator LiaR
MKVIVADNHPAICSGLREMLLRTDMRVVGEAGDGEEVLRLVEELRPGLVILGLNLVGEVDGVEACRRIKDLPSPPRVLVYTAFDFTDELSSSLLSEADSYLHKRACREELLDAIRRTAAGERVWPTSEGIGEPRSRLHATQEGMRLTPKEREVLVLITYGCSNGK